MDHPTDLKSNIEHHIVTVTTQTVDLLFSVPEYQDALILYFFYIKTAKWQKNTTIHANDVYGCQSLKWGRNKYYAARATLKKLDLIEDVVRRNKDNEIIGHYTLVKFIWKSTVPETDTMDHEPTVSTFHTMGNKQHIPYVTKKIPYVTKEKIKKENLFVEDANKILSHWNTLYHTRYQTPKAILNNLEYWRDSYSLDDILKAITNIQHEEYWKERMTPMILFRRRNPRGEDVDYIGHLLNIDIPEPFYTPEEQSLVDETEEMMRKMGKL